jgi:copper resistance protein B
MRPTFPLIGLLLATAGNAQAQHSHHPHTPSAAPVAMARPVATGEDAQAAPHAMHAPQVSATTHDVHAAHRATATPTSPAPDHHAHSHDSTPPSALATDHRAHGQPVPATAVDPHAGHRGAAGAAPAVIADHRYTTPAHPAALPAPTAAALAAAFPALQAHSVQHASAFNHLLLVDHLEAWNAAGGQGQGQAWEITGWAGSDTNRLWLRSEGLRERRALQDWSAEVLYGHSVSAWWDVVAGLRHDGGHYSQRTRAGIGVQGMAPYKFEVAATLWLGGTRRAELALQAEYQVLLSNRLILQPGIEANVFADDDPAAGIGRGLGEVEAGLRLRYEINRRFAPYIGHVQQRRFGPTASLSRTAGQPTHDARWVAGVRFWF